MHPDADLQRENLLTFCLESALGPGGSLSVCGARHFGNMAVLVLYSGLLASQRQVAMISEMIHSASLIHDDVVDQADCRRGKPSVNVLWNHKKVSAAFPGHCSRECCLLRYTAFVHLCCIARCTHCCLFQLLIISLPCSPFQFLLYLGAVNSDLSWT